MEQRGDTALNAASPSVVNPTRRHFAVCGVDYPIEDATIDGYGISWVPTTLIIPDRPGNRRVDSFSNVIRRPGIGLIFLVPVFDETLRVNGTGRVVTDGVLLTPLEARQGSCDWVGRLDNRGVLPLE